MFYKFSEFLDFMKQKLVNIFEPGEKLCIDETLHGFRGRCAFRQYMPKKASRYGIKLWSVVCTLTGYVCDIDLYLGQDKNSKQKKDPLGCGGNVDIFFLLKII